MPALHIKEVTMSFLYFLQQIRNPVADAVFSAITVLGEESLFLVFALFLFWCVDKNRGYYLLTVSFVGLTINQSLKLLFRIPRPWVLDPDFPIVESAREAATGYSFPSGHTQNAVNTFGSIARSSRRRVVWGICIAITLLVAFSRLYLGVHTPLDVVTSLLIGTLLVFGIYPLMQRATKSAVWMYGVSGGMLLIAIAYVIFAEAFPFPSDIDVANLASGQKNAWTILGCATAMPVIYTVDQRFLHFKTEAPLPAQIGKLVCGAALALLIKSVLKAPLLALCGGHCCANAIRYFCVVVFAAVIWPLTFPLWTRIFTKKAK
jgi:undecaprenyl-diphosphatase